MIIWLQREWSAGGALGSLQFESVLETSKKLGFQHNGVSDGVEPMGVQNVSWGEQIHSGNRRGFCNDGVSNSADSAFIMRVVVGAISGDDQTPESGVTNP